jgi:hypothetical protein
MPNGYIVSFYPGCAGRFISSIVYRMKNDVNKQIKLTEENSAHVENEWNKDKIIASDITLHTNLFKDINFLPDDNLNVLPTHHYPNFDDWAINPNRNSFDTIVITMDKNSLLEVCGNIAIKNFIACLKKPRETLPLHSRMTLAMAIKFYEKEFKRPATVAELENPVNFKNYVFKRYNNTADSEFFNLDIPNEFKDKVLELKYNELFIKDDKGNFITLLKLANWLNVTVTDSIVLEYEKYAQGRIDLIKTKMHWLNSST